MLRETREQFWLSLPQAGTYLLRVHYSPYWRVDDPAAACVEPGPHGMTQLRVVDPGPLRLRIDVNAAQHAQRRRRRALRLRLPAGGTPQLSY